MVGPRVVTFPLAVVVLELAERVIKIPKVYEGIAATYCILNDDDIENKADQFGRSLCLEADFTAWLARIASTRCRFLIGSIVSDRAYVQKVADGNYAFLRNNAAYEKCMEEAYRKFKWTARRLK